MNINLIGNQVTIMENPFFTYLSHILKLIHDPTIHLMVLIPLKTWNHDKEINSRSLYPSLFQIIIHQT